MHKKKIYRGNPLNFIEPYSDYRLVTDKTATLAEVAVEVNGIIYHGTGNSWRVKGDEYDKPTGSLIATYRAVNQLTNMLKQAVSNLDEHVNV